MNQHVLLEVLELCAGVIALFASESFFSGMNQHVAIEVRRLFGRVSAHCASEKLLTTMNQHMFFEMTQPNVCVVAFVATVGLFSFIQTLLFCKIVYVHFHFLLLLLKGF